MRRVISISAIFTLIISVVSPALVSAWVAVKTPMACHRATLQDAGQGMTHQHCHEMEGMDAAPEKGDGAAISSSAANCPMECCTLARSANHAAPASPLILAARFVVEHSIPAARIIFGRNGFSSHTDRGPPVA